MKPKRLCWGLREVIEVGDPILANAARNALAKLAASLPDRLSRQMQNAVLSAKRFHNRPEITIDVALIREAARNEQAIHIHYADVKGEETERTIWPLSHRLHGPNPDADFQMPTPPGFPLLSR